AAEVSRLLGLTAGEVDLALATSCHQVLNGIARRFALAKNGVHLLGYGHFYSMLLRKLHGGISGVDTFGNHAVHASDNLRQFAAPTELDSHGTVAGEAAGAGEHKITQSRQS